jgi:hypothetical protein
MYIEEIPSANPCWVLTTHIEYDISKSDISEIDIVHANAN